MESSVGLAPGHGQAASVQWRLFLRALAEEVDSLAGAGERDEMLRGIGRRMARMMPLPAVDNLPALEMEMNDALETIGWGGVRLHVNETERALHVVHTGLPRIGSLGAPAGHWLAAMLEGLYDSWFAQQPGSKPALAARRIDGTNGSAVVMRYAPGVT